MPINSFAFWIIFPILFVVYWLVPPKFVNVRKWYLVVVSYLLYMTWKPAFAVVLLFVTIVTYFGAITLYENRRVKDNSLAILLTLFLVLSLCPLVIFKYYNFINESIGSVLSFVGIEGGLPGLNWAIPVGISFFIFQALGYMVDYIAEQRNRRGTLLTMLYFVHFSNRQPVAQSLQHRNFFRRLSVRKIFL